MYIVYNTYTVPIFTIYNINYIYDRSGSINTPSILLLRVGNFGVDLK